MTTDQKTELLEQTNLHDFIMTTLVPQGYQMEIKKLNYYELRKLDDIVTRLIGLHILSTTRS